MADEVPDDEQSPRSEAFFALLGLSRGFFRIAIEGSVQHALAAPRDANPRPWKPHGSRNLGGRIRALAQDPQNPATIYAGLAQGGVFKSSDGGDTWTPIGRPQDAFPIGALAVAPGSPGRLYVGTGEPGGFHDDTGGALVPRETFAAGLGFFRWDESLTPPGFVREVGRVPAAGVAPNGAANGYARIVVDPDDRERCWIASNTGLWRREAGPVFHREPVPNPLPAAGAAGTVASDVIVVVNFDPAHPDRHRLYAAIATVGIFRGVWDPGAGAVNWEAQPLTDGWPDASASGALTFDRVRVAACRSDPRHVYAMLGAHHPDKEHHVLAVYYSDNGGDSWQERKGLGLDEKTDIGGQVWVNLRIEIHPDNPALVIAGAVDLARSRDFGKSWEKIIDWSNFSRGDRAQHSDQHDVFFDVANPERLWASNDGGVSMAYDIVEGNPHTDLSWRKRSHGLVGAQFNDITVHPSYPFIMGGGLQDNGTYIGYGGSTWYAVGDADGGQIAFDVGNPRRLITPNQARILRSTIQPGSADSTNRGYPLLLRGQVCADQAPPNDVLATRLATTGALPNANGALWVAVVTGHPTTAQHLLIGRTGAAFFSTNFGTSFTNAGIGAGFGPGEVGAVAYGSGAAPGADWWIGTSRGRLHLGTGALPKAWTNVSPPGIGGRRITSIAVHPANNNYVAVSTAGFTATPQGRVYLTIDQGANWSQITGLASVGAPPVGAPPLQSLPPSPITSLVFDPTVPVGNPQCLFAGTLAGVYVIRNLPAANAAAGPVAAFNPQWFSFNNGWTPPDAFHPVVAAGTNYARDRATAPPAAGVGTISSAANNDIVTGVGTAFTAFFQPGDVIRTTGLARDQARGVAVVIDDTHLSTVHQAPAADRFTPALPAAGTSFVIDTGSGQPTAGTGTITSGADTTLVTGNGTLFTAEVNVGDVVRTTGLAENQEKRVIFVLDDTHLITVFQQPVGELPLVLVKSLALVTLAATPGAPPAALEAAPRQRLLAAVYGRGIWECDLTPTNALAGGYPAGGPRHRLFVRQHLIEDGLAYPRPTPATLNSGVPPAAAVPRMAGDPRMPLATVNFTDNDAFDIRVDRAPFQFFEDVIDGVEFDEDLRSKTVKPGEPHVVYVQVHSRGWDRLDEVEVRLFFAPAPAPGAAPLPDLHVGFWANHTAVPLPAPAPVDAAAPRAAWRRVKDHRTLTVGPNQPAVTRFEWFPPADLGGHVALLAVATSAVDPLPAGLPEVMATLIRQERRVALRVVVAEPFAPDVFVRDGVDDAGALGGVTFGGRSPDIVVVDAPPPNSPEQDFADRLDPRTGDRIDPSKPNIVYVRVHNRSSLETRAEVELFWVKANVATATPVADAPPFDHGQWKRIDAANVDVPAGGSAFAQINWPQANIPDLSGDPFQALTLVALIRATTGPDIRPDRTRIADLDTFWRFFRVLRDSNNAAMRTVLYKV